MDILEKGQRTIGRTLTQDQIESLYFTILSTTKLTLNVVRILFQNMCCRCRMKSIKKQAEMKLLAKGKNKLFQNLDIVRILNTVNSYEIISRTLFNKNQRLLLKFQRRNTLQSETSSTSSNDDEADEIAIRQFLNRTEEGDEKSKKFAKRILSYFQSLKESEISYLDKRLLSGIWEGKEKNIQAAVNGIAPIQNSFDHLMEGIERVRNILDERPDTEPQAPDIFKWNTLQQEKNRELIKLEMRSYLS